MNRAIPGTVLTGTTQDLLHIDQMLDSLFLAGGMTRSQVVTITGLEPYTVQNWVKRGFLSPPAAKRYSKRQLCRILNINALKNALPMERICGLLTYVNGHLDDESDDLIDDSDLYTMFVRLVSRVEVHEASDSWPELIEKELANYAEPAPGAKDRVARVLQVMLLAWASASLRAEAEALLNTI